MLSPRIRATDGGIQRPATRGNFPDAERGSSRSTVRASTADINVVTRKKCDEYVALAQFSAEVGRDVNPRERSA